MRALLTTITITRVTRREPSSRRSPQKQRGPNHVAPLPLTMNDTVSDGAFTTLFSNSAARLLRL